jgi:siroheme synthase (precorrin-2 oxidase/ferrochelatase)
MTVDAAARARRWAAYAGSWREFLKAEQPRREKLKVFEYALYRAVFMNQSPEWTAYQSARRVARVKKGRSAKHK